MRNIKLTIEYDGTNYNGWQKQKNGITIQEEIEKAIKKITLEDVEVIGSSRTDSGVHARGMVCNFKTNSKIPTARFREAINTKLPDDIAILLSEEVDESFHARYNTKGKKYSYTIINRLEKVAIERNFSYHVKDNLNVDKMKKACEYFIGTHDFSAFKSTGSSVKTSIRTIYDIHIEVNNEKIKLIVHGNGFLYNMVRIIVGTLVEVGRGKISCSQVQEAIESGDRKATGPCAPANGLVLEEVYY